MLQMRRRTARRLTAGARSAAVGMARGTRGAATQVAEKVRENPWPALLIGAGATWMIFDATRAGSRRRTAVKLLRRANRAARATLRGAAENVRSLAGKS